MAVLFNNADCYSQDNKPEVIPENQIEKELSPQEKEAIKEKDVKIAFILLAGVIFIGGFTILLLLIWGYRVRRVIREPLAPCKPVDPLWFLKTKNEEELIMNDGKSSSEDQDDSDSNELTE